MMKLTVTTSTGRLAFDNVELVIANDLEICILQPNIGNRRGSRRTKIDQIRIIDFHVEVITTEKEGEEQNRKVDSKRDKS